MATESPKHDYAEVQARLMRMLDSVRLEKPEDPAKKPPAQQKECPNCGSQESWGISSWCPACGYYPKLGRVVSAGEETSPEDLSPPLDLSWTRPLLIGMFLLLLESVAIRLIFPDIQVRSQWATAQLALGGLTFLVSHVLAYAVAAGTSDKISPSNLFFGPGAIWAVAFKNPEKSSRLLCAAGCSLTAMVLALGVIGFDWNSLAGKPAPKKKKMNPIKAFVKAAATTGTAMSMAQGGGNAEEEEEEPTALGGGGGGGLALPPSGRNGSFEDSLKDFADVAGADTMAQSTGNPSGRGGSNSSGSLEKSIGAMAGTVGMNGTGGAAGSPTTGVPASGASVETAPLARAVKKAPPTSSGEERSRQEEFVIFGFLTNGAGEIRSVLLAERSRDSARFAGKLSLDGIDPAVREQLQSELENLRTARPPLKTPYHANWVRPVVTCEVAHTGRGADGQLKDGYLVDFSNRDQPAP
ncbi:hypothetical protein [Planctomicrobium sp. SH664]|uniref:hypothetical protein n=1 Tax=Planctomicrobium sp. SH664 TaxID=3448125 RepID=UPI003F5C008B